MSDNAGAVPEEVCIKNPVQAASGQAVAWRVKDYADGWILFHNKARAEHEAEVTGALIQPLYPFTPPQADAVQREESIIANAWQMLKASECTDPSCNRAYKYLESAAYGLPPPAVQGQGEAVKSAIEKQPYTEYSFPAKTHEQEKTRAEKYARIIASIVFRALPAEAPNAGIDVEALKKLNEFFVVLDTDLSWDLADYLPAIKTLYEAALQSAQPAKESGA